MNLTETVALPRASAESIVGYSFRLAPRTTSSATLRGFTPTGGRTLGTTSTSAKRRR